MHVARSRQSARGKSVRDGTDTPCSGSVGHRQLLAAHTCLSCSRAPWFDSPLVSVRRGRCVDATLSRAPIEDITGDEIVHVAKVSRRHHHRRLVTAVTTRGHDDRETYDQDQTSKSLRRPSRTTSGNSIESGQHQTPSAQSTTTHCRSTLPIDDAIASRTCTRPCGQLVGRPPPVCQSAISPNCRDPRCLKPVIVL